LCGRYPRLVPAPRRISGLWLTQRRRAELLVSPGSQAARRAAARGAQAHARAACV
jgi:hypothetical protein